MDDLPKKIEISEEGPREGFQIEGGHIATERKVALIDALSLTGLRQIQIASFVNPKRVPGMADVDQVVAGYTRKEGIRYTGIWLNQKGLLRALASNRIDVEPGIVLSASEAFTRRNQNRSFEEDVNEQVACTALFRERGMAVQRATVIAAFGCNFAGAIPVDRVLDVTAQLSRIASDSGGRLETLSLADTMAWATPLALKRLVGAVRDRWPNLTLSLHLHDTRGMALALAYAGLQIGVDRYDSAVGGLGGCPFAGHAGAAGNICTEDLVFMCEEMGISTGVNLEQLIEAARLAESIAGRPLPGAVMRGGDLARLRKARSMAVSA